MSPSRPNTLATLSQDLGRVEGKIDTFISQMKAQDDRTTDLEVRTRRVEGRLHWYSGIGSLAGLILGALGVHGLHGGAP